MLKSTKDEQLRAQTISDIEAHQNQPDAVTYFADMERVTRLRSDAISTPLYAVALLQAIPDVQTKITEAYRLFGARSQFPTSYQEIAKVLLPVLGQDVSNLGAYCDMTRGTINVEKYYVEAEIRRMQLLELDEAASIAEKLSAETAMQVPYDIRIEYVAIYLQIIAKTKDNVRILLAGYKFRNDTFEQFAQSKDTTDEQRVAMHYNRIIICKILCNALLYENRFQDACAYFQHIIESYEALGNVEELAAVLELALITSFATGDHERFLKSGYFDYTCHITKRAVHDQIRWVVIHLAQVLRSQRIDNYDTLRNMDFSFVQHPNLEAYIMSGFVRLQFDKIYGIYERITLMRISELIGIENVEVEKILLQQNYNIKIDRTTGEVLIQQRSSDDKYLEMSKSVYDILWSVAECSYLLGSDY